MKVKAARLKKKRRDVKVSGIKRSDVESIVIGKAWGAMSAMWNGGKQTRCVGEEVVC